MFKLACKVTILSLIVLLATTAFAVTAAQDNPATRTVLQPDLSLKTVLSPDLIQPGTVAGARPPSFMTCVCSCGYPCTTNADCGPGGICGKGITCCATQPANDATLKIFQEREQVSSRQTPSLLPSRINCKQK